MSLHVEDEFAFATSQGYLGQRRLERGAGGQIEKTAKSASRGICGIECKQCRRSAAGGDKKASSRHGKTLRVDCRCFVSKFICRLIRRGQRNRFKLAI